MRLLLTVIALTFISFHGSGQIKVGISGGINLTSLQLDPDYFENQRSIPRFGCNFGIEAEFPLSKHFYVGTETSLVSKSFAFNVQDFYGEDALGYDRYNILYLNLPLKFGYTFGEYRVFTGVNFDYYLKSMNQHEVSYPEELTAEIALKAAVDPTLPQPLIYTETFPIKSQFQYDTGFLIGVGHHNDCFGIDLTYNFGLINIFPDNIFESRRNEHPMYTRVLDISLLFYL